MHFQKFVQIIVYQYRLGDRKEYHSVKDLVLYAIVIKLLMNSLYFRMYKALTDVRKYQGKYYPHRPNVIKFNDIMPTQNEQNC
jgi:hypothetical protein